MGERAGAHGSAAGGGRRGRRNAGDRRHCSVAGARRWGGRHATAGARESVRPAPRAATPGMAEIGAGAPVTAPVTSPVSSSPGRSPRSSHDRSRARAWPRRPRRRRSASAGWAAERMPRPQRPAPAASDGDGVHPAAGGRGCRGAAGCERPYAGGGAIGGCVSVGASVLREERQPGVVRRRCGARRGLRLSADPPARAESDHGGPDRQQQRGEHRHARPVAERPRRCGGRRTITKTQTASDAEAGDQPRAEAASRRARPAGAARRRSARGPRPSRPPRRTCGRRRSAPARARRRARRTRSSPMRLSATEVDRSMTVMA